MGKASRWFRRLLGLRKQPPNSSSNPSPSPKKNRWGFSKSSKNNQHVPSQVNENLEVVSNKSQVVTNTNQVSKEHSLFRYHKRSGSQERVPFRANEQVSKEREPVKKKVNISRIPSVHFNEERAQVSKEMAQVREARTVLRSKTHVTRGRAAVVIQAHFRSYLARRALRALKSLVKLQALVRGHIIRKQTADMLRRMHALLRAQARARAGRAQISESPSSSAKSSKSCHPGPPTPEKFEHIIRSNSARHDHSPILKRNGSKSSSRRINDQEKQQNGWYWSDHLKGHLENNENSDKIVEIDFIKPHLTSGKKGMFHSTNLGLSSDQYSHSFSTSKDSTTLQTLASPSSYEVRSFSPWKVNQDVDESPFCTAHNSPQFYSASSRGGSSKRSPFTPAKSDGSKSCLSAYSDHPSYMACTESSKAKIRSLSAPRQRPQMERTGSARRYLVYNYDESKVSDQAASAFRSTFVNKAYPGSGRLDRLSLPMTNGGFLNGY